jgi:hypothetical protein
MTDASCALCSLIRFSICPRCSRRPGQVAPSRPEFLLRHTAIEVSSAVADTNLGGGPQRSFDRFAVSPTAKKIAFGIIRTAARRSCTVRLNAPYIKGEGNSGLPR